MVRRWGMALLGLTACASGNALTQRQQALSRVTARAAEQGARRCAPEELALAEAHLEFAALEVEQGDPKRAGQHLVLAEANAKAALRLSPEDRCLGANTDQDGDGVPDREDACPDRPEDHDGVRDEDGCPDDFDADGDGLTDAKDLCPAAAEDPDGYFDDDGCPDPDNDLDGLADADDRCPDEGEDPDGVRDDDGCPDPDNDMDGVPDVSDECPAETGDAGGGCPRLYQGVVITSSRLALAEPVQFAPNQARIQPASYGLLDSVAQALRDHPDMRVEVQVHTDSGGPAAHNRRLSQERAEAVREYLQAKGIAARRMIARGYGEERPIASNRTARGREANRRVEFVRLDAGGPPAGTSSETQPPGPSLTE